MPLLLLTTATSAHAWGWGPWLGGPNQSFQGFHHWGFDNYQGSDCSVYCQGQQDAIYDHEQNLVYNPVPQCCHSEYYRQAFSEGYTHQWNTEGHTQNQEQNSEQKSMPAMPRQNNVNGDCENGCPWGQGS